VRFYLDRHAAAASSQLVSASGAGEVGGTEDGGSQNRKPAGHSSLSLYTAEGEGTPHLKLAAGCSMALGRRVCPCCFAEAGEETDMKREYRG